MTDDHVAKAKRKGVGGVLLALGLVAGIGGVVLVVIASLDAGKAELLGKARRVEAGAAEGSPPAGEALVVHGRLGADRPARMPGRGEAVIQGKLEIEESYEHRSEGKTKTKTRTLFQQTVLAEGVYVEGMNGGVRFPIDPEALKGAELSVEEQRETLRLERASGLFATSKLRYGDIAVDVSDSSNFRSAHAVKSGIEPGKEVWVVGALQDRGGARVLVAPPGESMSILLENADAAQARLADRSAWMLPLGGVLAVVGLVLLLPGLLMLIRG